MSDIKSTLSLLCRELKFLCGVDVKAEDIRRAKFNHKSDNNVEIFWLVLYRLCHKLMRNGSDASTASLEVQVIFVQLCLATWGYQRVQFYNLPENGERGSQELLIALAWLLAKQNVFDKLISCKIWLFKQELKNHENETKKSYCKETSRSIKFEDELNKAMLLCGKLKHNTNEIFRLKQQSVNLLNKIHCETQGLPELHHLSLYEASIFFKDINGLLKSGKELQDIINTHNQWEEKSCLFWEWMDTVLVEARANSTDNAVNQYYLRNFLQVLIARLKDNLASTEKASSTIGLKIVHNIIFSIHTEEKKALELKILKKLLSDQLSDYKSACKDVEMALQRQIKSIIYNMTNTQIFIQK